MAIKDTGNLTFNNLISYLNNKKIKINFKKNNFNIYDENSKHLLIIFTSIHDFYSLLENNKIYKFENIFLDKMNCRDLANRMKKNYLNKKIPVAITLEKFLNEDYYTLMGWCHVNWYLNKTTSYNKYKIIVISNRNQQFDKKELNNIKIKRMKI